MSICLSYIYIYIHMDFMDVVFCRPELTFAAHFVKFVERLKSFNYHISI